MKHIVVMAYWEAPFRNEDLAKDCGLVPYIIGTKSGSKLILVTGPGEEYTYTKLMPEYEIHYLPDNSVEAKCRYLEEHGKDIDLLMLYGVTTHNIYSANTIKRVNPKCMITCALDMNDEYADRIPFYEEPFSSFFNSIDLMWQATEQITDFLNKKWNWEVICARNGYYDLFRKTSEIEYYPFEERENTIVYVGRINNGQKAHKSLLEAFAQISSLIPEWKLKMVGNIESPFEEIIDAYYDYYPELVDRVIFTGRIDDRNELHHEYERAKIYASTSVVEGGPNAYSEALCSGCVMAITKISSYIDYVGNEESGLAVSIGDTKAFAETLLRLCTHDKLKQMSHTAYKRGKELFSLERTVDMLYGKLRSKGF